MKEKILKIELIILLVLLLVLNYGLGFLGDGNLKFDTFQNDSEYLVLSQIYEDKYEANSTGKNYGLATVKNSDGNRIYSIREMIENTDMANKEIQVLDYESQFGLQGYVFSFLYNKMHLPIKVLKSICCILLAVVVVAICYIISRKYNKLMGGIFYITFLLSPWIVVFARNLYWVEFTWFLPALFGLILSYKNYSKKLLIIPCIFISIFIKCLCGYEYISTIMLMTIAFFVIDFFTTKDKDKRKQIFFTIIEVGIICILAFATALCIHAQLKGDGNIIEGLKNIYEKDVLRRTVIPTDITLFDEILYPSLEAGIFETVYKYFNWNTPIIIGLSGDCFKLMIVATIAILFYSLIKKDKYVSRDITMFVMFLITTLSWYILGKAHSYVHIYMNYVLWYFGFIQICLYICLKFIAKLFKKIGNGEYEK